MSIDIKGRQALAADLHRQGYNCCQSILLAFEPELGLPRETLAAIGAGMGGGVGARGELCGVVSGVAIADGLRHGGEPTAKAAAYKRAGSLVDKFREETGALRCHDLKRPGCAFSCPALIDLGVKLFAQHLDNQ